MHEPGPLASPPRSESSNMISANSLPWNFRSVELSFQRTFAFRNEWVQELLLHGTFVLVHEIDLRLSLGALFYILLTYCWWCLTAWINVVIINALSLLCWSLLLSLRVNLTHARRNRMNLVRVQLLSNGHTIPPLSLTSPPGPSVGAKTTASKHFKDTLKTEHVTVVQVQTTETATRQSQLTALTIAHKWCVCGIILAKQNKLQLDLACRPSWFLSVTLRVNKFLL